LIELGANVDQISTSHEGEVQELEDTAEARKRNRRVDVQVIRKDQSYD